MRHGTAAAVKECTRTDRSNIAECACVRQNLTHCQRLWFVATRRFTDSIISAGSANIDISQKAHNGNKDDDNYLALRTSTGEFLLNGAYQVSARAAAAGGHTRTRLQVSVFRQEVPVQDTVRALVAAMSQRFELKSKDAAKLLALAHARALVAPLSTKRFYGASRTLEHHSRHATHSPLEGSRLLRRRSRARAHQRQRPDSLG